MVVTKARGMECIQDFLFAEMICVNWTNVRHDHWREESLCKFGELYV